MKFLLLAPIYLTVLFTSEPDFSKSVLKKINKAIYQQWKIENIQKEAIMLSGAQKVKLGYKVNNNQVYRLTTGNSLLGYLYFAKAKSQYAIFDYMIIFNTNLKILRVKVLVYPEFYGGEIANTNWLKQFIGKTDPQNIIFGKTVDSISGATISAKSITNGVRTNVTNMKELKKHEIIP